MPNIKFENYKTLPIDKLVKADWNYKTDNDSLKDKLKNNIKRNGQIENIIVRELPSGFFEIVNGNHRYDALTELNFVEVVVYDLGKISLAAAQRIAIETNETRFDTDSEKLGQLLKELSDEFPELELLETMPFSEEQFNNLLDFDMSDLDTLLNEVDTDDDNTKSETKEDDYDEQPPDKAKTVKGDLYEFNGHRLLCGDSTKEEDVQRLMNGKNADMVYTDPPYNIKYTALNKNRNNGGGKDWDATYCTEWKDDMPDEDYEAFVTKFINNAKNHLIEYGHYYIWYASTYHTLFTQVLQNLNISYDKPPIIWVKNVAPPSWSRYMRLYEPCIFAGKDAVKGSKRWFGPTNSKNVWFVNRDHNGSYIHPTQKPVALAAIAISNSSQPGETVLDLFMGSGTTFIASDQLGRIAYGMEYGEDYCDNIIKRYMKYCSDNQKEANVLLNGQPITLDYFDIEDEDGTDGNSI